MNPLWRLVPGVRPRERERFLFFMTLSGLVSLSQTLGIAGSEALFLSHVGVEWLPETLIAASSVTVLGSFVYGMGVGRARNDTFFAWLLVGGAAVLFATVWPARAGIVWVFPVLMCFFFLAHAVLINHYWTFTSDYFDTISSKRLFPLFNIGNSLGGFAGGFLAAGIARFLSPETLIPAWGISFLAAAALLRSSRRRLRRWGPMELEELDETSVEGIRGAVRYIRSASIARWLVLSTVGMVLSLFIAQFIYSDLLQRAYPTAAELATFLAIYLGITNLIEVGIEIAVTPWLIQRLGVPSANLVHPLLTLLSFGALAIDYRLSLAVLARVNKELLENALAQPVRVLVYNALPARFRGRLRLFQEGIVFYGGMAGAGLVLLAIGPTVEPLWLCLAGGAMALLYLGANLKLRSEYLGTLTTRLRTGRLDLRELEGELGAFEISRLAALWETTIATTSGYPGAAELELPALLVQRGVAEPVLRSAQHPDPRIRAVCVTALAAARPSAATEVDDALVSALSDSEAPVRLAAVRALSKRGDTGPAIERSLLDGDPTVRAEAARALGAKGLPLLERMASSDDRAERSAALERLPVELVDRALALVDADDPALRAQAIESASRLQQPVQIPAERLAGELDHADGRVRRAAVIALGTRDDGTAYAALGRALEDPSREVRRLAETALGRAGEAALGVLVPRLQGDHTGSIESAIGALAHMAIPPARAALNEELRRRVREAWQGLGARILLADADTVPLRFLDAAYASLVRENRRLAFRILELLEDAKVMRTVESVLRYATGRVRADALEVLSNLGDRDVSLLLVPLLESGPIEDRIISVAPHVPLPRDLDQAISVARGSNDRWVRMAASAHESSESEEAMERLLVLRRISLFEGLTLEQLEAVNRIMTEAHYLEGEVIFHEGDVGRELYLVVEGEVGIYKNHGTEHEIEYRRHPPATYTGEIAILADQPRSASAVALKDSSLLVLNGDFFKELILERPEISFEIFRALTNRLLEAEARADRAS